MRKILSFFIAILFASSMMAEVGNLYYTFLPYKPSNGAVSDYTKTGTMTIDEMKWTVPGNWYANGELRLGGKSITNVDRVITAQDAMGSAISKIRIAHTGVTSDKITLNSVTVTTASDADFTQNVTTKTVSDFTVAKNTTDTIDVVPATEPWAINSYYKIAFNITNSAGSNYSLLVKSILFYAYAKGVDPEPTEKTLYLKLSSDWAGWPAKYAVYYFNDTENGWSEFMTKVEGEENTYTATIPVGYSKVIFVRFNSEKTATGNWDDKWSQTVDLTIPENKNHFTVTSGGTGSECDGTWSKYPVIPTYYVKGTFDEWGDGHEMTEGTYTFENLAAGTYQIKVVDDANNWLGYDYLDATKSSDYIYSQGDEKNIKFTLAEAGNVTVAYDGAKIIVTGTFVAPTTKFTVTVPEGTENVYIAGNFNNWTFAQMTLKAGEEDVFELTVSEVESDTVAYKYLAGTDWKFEEVIENNRSYNAADEVSAWKAVPTIYKYAKVKEAPVNWTGHYILAWEDLKPHSAINGSDFVADANAAAFLAGDTISIMEGNDFAVDIRFSETAGAYTAKLPNGKYLAIPSSSNAMSEQEDPFAFSMAYFKGENQEGVQFGNGDLTSTSTRMMYKNNNYFRSYTNKINNTSYKLPTLYRLVDEAFDCQDGPYALLVNGTIVIPAKMEAKEGYNEYAMYASLVKGDSVQVLNTSCGGLWIPTLEEAGAAEHFAKGLAAATVDSTGCYDFYFKQIPNDQKMYIGFGICADDTIRYTVRGKGGILGEDFENAFDSKQDTLEFALEAGKYELKVVVGADWKGFEQLTDTANGLTVGEMDNICFELNEAGTVQVVYNDSVFKLIGNFYVAPIKYYIAGSMTKWAEEMVELLPLEEKADSLGIAINLEADSLYAFKVVRVQGTDTAWYGLGEAATMEYGNSEGWWIFKSENDQNQANVGLMTTKAAEYPFVVKVADGHMEVSVAIPARYYAKYSVGETWAWSMMTEKEGKWIADSVVYRGGGANVYFAEDNDHAWYFNESGEDALKAINAYEGFAALDTVQFSFNPVDTTLTAILIGKYVEPTYAHADGYYLVGDFDGVAAWDIDDQKILVANTETEGEFFIENITLTVDDSLKVIYVEKDQIITWYPTDNNYVVDAAHAGVKTIYFNPIAQEAWGGHIFIAENPTPAQYGILLNGEFLPAEKNDEYTGEGEEWVVNTTMHIDDEFQIYDNANKVGWIMAIDEFGYNEFNINTEEQKYIVTANGNYALYIRLIYNADKLYVGYTAEGTDIDILDTNAPAVKILRDGQILIIKGTKTFNIQGQLVR